MLTRLWPRYAGAAGERSARDVGHKTYNSIQKFGQRFITEMLGISFVYLYVYVSVITGLYKLISVSNGEAYQG